MEQKSIGSRIKGLFYGRPEDKLRMVISVIVMGICVRLLTMTSFGPDPCSAMNYGMSALLGLSFGTYQAILNTLVFIIVFMIDSSQLGLGSFGNMILVGYSADLTQWFMEHVIGVDAFTTPGTRLAVMIPSLAVFVLAAAMYMNCGLGTAPYDACSFLIHRKLCSLTGRQIPFMAVRIVYDGLVTAFAVLIDGEVGIVTFLMLFTLGPAVDAMGRLISRGRKGN